MNSPSTSILFHGSDKSPTKDYAKLKNAFDRGDLKAALSMAPWDGTDVINGFLSMLTQKHHHLQDELLWRFDDIVSSEGIAFDLGLHTVMLHAIAVNNTTVVDKIDRLTPDKNHTESFLFFAAECGRPQLWEMFYNKYPDQEWVDQSLAAAARYGRGQMIDLIMTKKPSLAGLEEALGASLGAEHFDFSKALISHPDIDGTEMFHMATRLEYADGMRMLLPSVCHNEQIVAKAFTDTRREEIAEILTPYLDLNVLEQTLTEWRPTLPDFHKLVCILDLLPFHKRIIQALRDRQELNSAIDVETPHRKPSKI